MKNKLHYLLFLALINFAYGQTNVSGGLFSNTTWDLAGSPYIITSDVALFPGYSLTIEPGVTVKFDSGTKLILRGALISNATEGNEVIFTSNLSNPTKGSWQGIEIENNQGGKITASYIKGEYADNFIRILNSSNGEVLNINNSEIKNCNYAFYGYDGHSNHTVVLDNLNVNNNNYAYIYAQNVRLSNSVFSDGEKGIHCWENIPNMSITKSEFYNFSVWPFNMEGTIDECNIHDNAVGIRMKPNLIVKNSKIESNTIGIEVNYPISISGENIFNNNICNNSQYNLKHLYSYPISIKNNYWCLTSEEEISQTIFDAYDDVSLGIVTFSPFNSNSTLNINDYSNKTYFSFYPNPSVDQITFSDSSMKNFKIYSVNGTMIKKGTTNEKLDIKDLSQGLYVIKISNLDNSKYSIRKLIKK